LRFQAQKQLQISARQEQSREASKVQPASAISLLLLAQREGAAARAATWDLQVATFSPAPLSSLYFAGNKCLFSIKKFGTVVLPWNVALEYCQGRLQNILLKNQNTAVPSCY